jgi:Ribbon-helix-helix protein, copG family
MKKTSVYLTEGEADRLAELARVEGRPQAEVLRAAIAQYRTLGSGDRAFAVTRSGRGPAGTSVAEVPEEELLRGFGAS